MSGASITIVTPGPEDTDPAIITPYYLGRNPAEARVAVMKFMTQAKVIQIKWYDSQGNEQQRRPDHLSEVVNLETGQLVLPYTDPGVDSPNVEWFDYADADRKIKDRFSDVALSNIISWDAAEEKRKVDEAIAAKRQQMVDAARQS